MSARKLGSLLTHFQTLADPRLERSRLHDLLDIVALTICAVICGADSWVDVHKYGQAKHDWLKGFLRLPNGVPSHDTFGRFFAALDPEQFQACFASWVAEVAGALDLKHVAIDGKTLRRSHDRKKGQAALHLVSAWAVGCHLSLGQEAVAEKSNEITDKKGDYVLTVKENQPTLYEQIERLDEAAMEKDYAGIDSSGEEEKGHGRQEFRACWVLTDLGGLEERSKWAGLQSVIVVVRDRTVGDKNSCEKHYYISSRKMSAEQFLEVIRGHWSIENTLHWVLDVVFDEDGSRVRKDHAPENFGLLRRMAVSMLKAEGSKGSIRGKRLTAGWNNDFLEKVFLDFAED